MKKEIIKIIKDLEETTKKYDYRILETAIVLWVHYGLDVEYTNKEIQEINDMIYNYDGSILNDDIVDFLDSLN